MTHLVPDRRSGGARLPRLLTPAGGIFLALGMSALLWSGLVEAIHLLGGF